MNLCHIIHSFPCVAQILPQALLKTAFGRFFLPHCLPCLIDIDSSQSRIGGGRLPVFLAAVNAPPTPATKNCRSFLATSLWGEGVYSVYMTGAQRRWGEGRTVIFLAGCQCKKKAFTSVNAHFLRLCGDNFLTLVGTTSLAGSVRHFELAAVGAFYHARNYQLPVCSSLISSCFRSFSLWNCHVSTPLSIFTQILGFDSPTKKIFAYSTTVDPMRQTAGQQVWYRIRNLPDSGFYRNLRKCPCNLPCRESYWATPLPRRHR